MELASICMYTAIFIAAARMAVHHKKPHTWMFTIAFAVALFRQVTAYIVSTGHASDAVALLDTGVLPMLAGLLILLALILHGTYFSKVKKAIEQHRQDFERSR